MLKKVGREGGGEKVQKEESNIMVRVRPGDKERGDDLEGAGPQ